jgi:hypothetical protein
MMDMCINLYVNLGVFSVAHVHEGKTKSLFTSKLFSENIISRQWLEW